MIAMRTQFALCACALQADELHCWYNDAQDVADVALLAAKAAEPDIDMPAPQVREGQKVQVEVSANDASPVTAKRRRSVAAAMVASALDTLPKRHPAVGLINAGMK